MTKSLPSKPNLKQLRNQAREILNAHKNGDTSCCVPLRHLSQFDDKSDEEILASSLKLTAAQYALALDYGFESWQRLREAAKLTHEDPDAPAAKTTCKHPLLERALREAVERKASDVHLVAGEPLTFRVSGAIIRLQDKALTADDVLSAAVAQFGEDTVANVEKAGGILTGCSLPGVSKGQATISISGGEIRIVIVLVAEAVVDYKEAGLPQSILDVAKEKSGLVVFAGQIGSGFKTSATSFVDYINQTQPVHILTIEDPVCGKLTPQQAIVQQREVGTDLPSTVEGIKFGIAQDVDVLYIAAMRATVELTAALTAAEAGLLVIIVVHGQSPDEVMDRIISAFPADERQTYRKRLARTLRAIVVQTLFVRDDRPGRVAAYGVLIPDDETRAAIAEGRNVTDRKTLSSGSRRMADHIRQLRVDGIIKAKDEPSALTSPTESTMVVAFTDIAKFTQISESGPDSQVVDVLSSHYELVGDIVESAGGTTVKFIGDSALIVFPGEKAQTGVDALRELKAQAEKQFAAAGFNTELTVKAHIGPVASARVGTRGDKRLDIFGDAVNKAARLPNGGFVLSEELERALGAGATRDG